MSSTTGVSSASSGAKGSLWRRLTEPARGVTDPEDRRRARLLAAVLLVLLPASMAAITAVPVSTVVFRAIVMVGAERFDIATLSGALSWTLMPVLLSNMVMPMRSTAIFVGLLCVGIALMPAFLAPVSVTDVVEPLGLIIAVSALVMVASGIRREDRLRIETQNIELSRSEQRFRGLFDGTSVGTCVHDPQGAIIDVNTAFERLFGYSLDQAMELGVTDLVAPEDHERLLEAIQERREEPLEVRGIRRDGSAFELEATANTHISRGEKIQLLELRDVSELREAQGEARTARLAAEEAARAQGEFLVHVGRTLRPPLNQAVSVVNTLAANRARNLRDEDLTFLRRLAEQHTALDNKIKDVLLLSQLETGRLGLNPTTTLLDRVVKSVLDASQSLIRRRPVTLSLVKPKLIAPVDVDVGRLRQVLKYLVASAINATETGFVTVRIAVDETTHAPRAISIEDASAGMSAQDQEKVFQPLEIALKEDDERLGLTICRALVELIGFTLQVESKILEGTTFTIHLGNIAPAQLGVQQHREPDAEPAAAAEPEPVRATVPPLRQGVPAAADADDEGFPVLLVGGGSVADLAATALDEAGGKILVRSTASPDLATVAAQSDVAVVQFKVGDTEQAAFGGLGVVRGLERHPPTVVLATVDDRMALMGPVDITPWPPSRDNVDPIVARHLQAVLGADKRRVLAVTANVAAGEELIIALKAHDCQVRLATDPDRALDTLRSAQFDLFVVDANVPLNDEMMSLLTELRGDRRYLSVPLVLGVADGAHLAGARRLELLAQSVSRPTDKLAGELRRLVQTMVATRVEPDSGAKPSSTVGPSAPVSASSAARDAAG